MTIIETPVEVGTGVSAHDLEESFEVEPLPHLKCCKVDRFYCGRRFHPELVADRARAGQDEVCKACWEVFMGSFWCVQGHQHCPIPLLGRFPCPPERG